MRTGLAGRVVARRPPVACLCSNTMQRQVNICKGYGVMTSNQNNEFTVIHNLSIADANISNDVNVVQILTTTIIIIIITIIIITILINNNNNNK